jgi:DNA-binding NarL/FixJ family response regulator
MTRDRIEGFDSGADAYLSKPFAPEELVAIVDNLIHRQAALNGFGSDEKQSPDVEDLKRDLEEIKNLLLYKGGGGIGNGFVMKTDVFLSSDERRVLGLLCEGLMNKEIAAATHLSTRRIEQLLTQMYRKTGVKNRTELVRWAVSSGNAE